MPTAARLRGQRPSEARAPPVPLTSDQRRTVLAALADVARREREHAAVMLTWGGPAMASAAADKRRFAEECEGAAAVVRAGMGGGNGDGHGG
jgi:hypothetical protein